MKHPFVKAVGAAILLCALLFGYYQMIVSHINARNVEILARIGENRLDSIIDAMNNFESDQENMTSAASQRLLASTRLEAAMLRRSAAYAELANRADSMVVRVIGERVITPADREEQLDYVDNIFGDEAKVSIGMVKASADADEYYAVVCACPVQGNEYFVCWTDERAIAQLFTARNDAQTKLLSSVETAHDGYFLEIQEWDDDLAFGYKSPDLAEYETPEKMGITRQVLRDRPDTLEIGGNSFHCNYRSIEEGKRTGVFLTPLTVATFQTENQAAIIAAIAGIMLVSVAVWHLATQRFVVDKILTKPMQSRYKPSKMRWTALVLGVIGVLVVFVTGCTVHSISDLFQRSVEAYVSLMMLDESLWDNGNNRAANAQLGEEWRLACARHVAEAIGADPGLAAGEPLAEFNDAIGATYIMLFDGDGDEYACSAGYTGFSLGLEPEDSTTDFRRLLLGVPELSHAPAVDERTGLNTRMVGQCCQMADGRYGALILAFEPDPTEEETGINDLLHSHTEPDWVMLAFDRESKSVRYSSVPEYIGGTIEMFGIPEERFGTRYMEAITIDNRHCYGFAMGRDDLIYYNVSVRSGLLRETAAYGIQAAAGFAVIYLVLSLCLLLGYTDKWYAYYSVIGSEYDSRGAETVLPNGKVKRSVDPSRRWAFSFTSWRNMLPEQVAKSVFSLGVSLGIAAVGVDFLIRRYNSNGIFAFIASGDWVRGFNLLAIVAILMLSLAVVFGLMLVRLALKLTSMALDTKGETICRLSYNLLQYVAVLGLLFYSFEFLGIDVRALLAPLALISLALSLGSRQLVEDILAGITIVFEGEYQVGDVIDVGGYRGKVVEVGVRTTKLLGKGDNIKIISNRDVRNVLNMSRLNSWIDMEFTVASTVPIQKIEEIMERELPKIGRSIPDIISGPTYKGIVSMNGNKITIAVTCECNEERSFRIQRKLYAKFHDMFERENLPLA